VGFVGVVGGGGVWEQILLLPVWKECVYMCVCTSVRCVE